MTTHVVATAGHVDHGKSTLIRALTGMEPDRWAEERRRGLTIDLGFAWTTLPSGREVAFVDVPGHERAAVRQHIPETLLIKNRDCVFGASAELIQQTPHTQVA